MTNPTRLPPAPVQPRTRNAHPAGAVLLALGLAVATTGRAAPTVADELVDTHAATLAKLGDDELLIEEVFQSHLPTTLEPYALRLSVNPHLGDWQKKEHMRLSTNLRYGLTEKCELTLGSTLYFSHGHGDVRAFEDYGAANLKLGAKYNLGRFPFARWETAAGAEYEFPTGRPPPELTDGLRHLRPYVTFSHRLVAHPNLRIFVGLRFDYVTHTSLPGEFGQNAFHESSTGITGGWVLDRDRLHYTLEATYDTNRLIGHGGEDIYTIRPGILWEIPTHGKWQIRSNWMIGLAVNNTFGPGGSSLGASFKLRYSSDLKNRFRRQRNAPAP